MGPQSVGGSQTGAPIQGRIKSFKALYSSNSSPPESISVTFASPDNMTSVPKEDHHVFTVKFNAPGCKSPTAF